VDIRHLSSLEPVVFIEALPVDPIKSSIGQFVILHVSAAPNVPEASLVPVVNEVIAEVVELFHKVLVGDWIAFCVDVSVSLPFDNVIDHAVDQVRGFSLDDDFLYALAEVAVCEHVLGHSQSVDGRP